MFDSFILRGSYLPRRLLKKSSHRCLETAETQDRCAPPPEPGVAIGAGLASPRLRNRFSAACRIRRIGGHAIRVIARAAAPEYGHVRETHGKMALCPDM